MWYVTWRIPLLWIASSLALTRDIGEGLYHSSWTIISTFAFWFPLLLKNKYTFALFVVTRKLFISSFLLKVFVQFFGTVMYIYLFLFSIHDMHCLIWPIRRP